AKQHIMAGGWHPGGKIPWGYRSRDATADERAQGAPQRVLDVDAETAPYVQELFRQVADGVSVRQAVGWAIRLPSYARGGRSLAYSTVRMMLQTPTYIGRSSGGAPGRWPAF